MGVADIIKTAVTACDGAEECVAVIRSRETLKISSTSLRVNNVRDFAKEDCDKLDATLKSVSEALASQMEFLKKLELDKIDFSLKMQTRQNQTISWYQREMQHPNEDCQISRDVFEDILVNEQNTHEENLRQVFDHISAVSNNIHRLREFKLVLTDTLKELRCNPPSGGHIVFRTS
eukprot:GEMP01063350.1.p1 GENE.GEMP01063350.1~~GEMP01063350.1.p1  ORF type:complete len:176 (+),score=31.89 GEMP01063350.1:89-616(+)